MINRCMKISKNDHNDPVHISIILKVDLAEKSLHVRPVEKDLQLRKQFETAIGELQHVGKHLSTGPRILNV